MGLTHSFLSISFLFQWELKVDMTNILPKFYNIICTECNNQLITKQLVQMTAQVLSSRHKVHKKIVTLSYESFHCQLNVILAFIKHVTSDLYGVVSIDNYLTYSPLLQPLPHTYARNITLIIRFTIQFKHFLFIYISNLNNK